MAGHFPFSGNGGRGAITAYYERHGLNDELQEKYYKWWYDQAKTMVDQDSELSQTKGLDFIEYPYGQHAHRSFHLKGKQWAVCLNDLGAFIKAVLLPKLDQNALHKLEEEHHTLMTALGQEATDKPREPVPDIGYFRHT